MVVVSKISHSKADIISPIDTPLKAEVGIFLMQDLTSLMFSKFILITSIPVL